MNDKLRDALIDIITPAAQAKNLELWGLEIASMGKKRVVRIYLEGEDGVTVGECAKVSREVGLALEVEDIMHGAYTLEVSSPGLDRKFFNPGQMEAYVGQDVDARLHDPQDGQRRFKGKLMSVEGSIITLETASEPARVDFDAIKTVRLVFEPPKKGK